VTVDFQSQREQAMACLEDLLSKHRDEQGWHESSVRIGYRLPLFYCVAVPLMSEQLLFLLTTQV